MLFVVLAVTLLLLLTRTVLPHDASAAAPLI